MSADGNTFTQANLGAAVGTNIMSLAAFNGRLFAGDGSGRVYVSTDRN